MILSIVSTYFHSILSHVPWGHWVVMSLLSLALTVTLLIRKKGSGYGAICLGITVFVGMLLMETAVVTRYLGFLSHSSGVNLGFALDRLYHGTRQARMETLSNIAVFVPFGFFLSEFLASTKRYGAWRRIGLAALLGLGLSLCIECLQLILHVGYFEVTDLVMNTVGAFVGAGMAVMARAVSVGKKES